MRGLTASMFFLAGLASSALAQSPKVPLNQSRGMEVRGNTLVGTPQNALPNHIGQLPTDIPVAELSKAAANPVVEKSATTRSARDVQLYRAVSPSVVLVVNKKGFGSGSLLDTSGDILTNWHVVEGYDYVAVIYKPTVEGQTPRREDIKLAHVEKFDQISDLALIKAVEVPPGRTPIRLGDSSEIAVGMDVHAIGHPEGEEWSYTSGIISQYRRGYVWQTKENPIKHNADVIQTQTPLNPGNSGGPLLTDSGDLIGVNSFIAKGEGLNYAVAVGEIRKFLARTQDRTVSQPSSVATGCKARKLATFRSKKNDANIVSFDFYCTGKDNAEYVVPDDKSKAIFLRLDRNGDGQADAMIFDLKRRGKWDISFWDTKFNGQWDLVGYHDDGSLKPSRFESYAEFQKRVASR